MRRAYSRGFTPPAPVIPVAVRFPDGATWHAVEGKLDTGADISVVPEHLVTQLDLPPLRAIRAAGFAGVLQETTTYAADLELGGIIFRHAEVLSTRRPYVIVGRDLLRRFHLGLNGPREHLDLRRPRGGNRSASSTR